MVFVLFCFLKKEIGFHESEKHEELIPLRDMMFVLKAEQSEMTGRGRAGRLSGKGQYKKSTGPGRGGLSLSTNRK